MKWGNKAAAKEEEVWFNKGFTLYSCGRFDEAIVCFDKALEINPQYVIARNNKAFAEQKVRWKHEATEAKASALSDSADPYEILGIPRYAPYKQVKDGWRELIKKYHPDMAKDKDITTQELYAREFDKINKAWEEIKKARGWN